MDSWVDSDYLRCFQLMRTSAEAARLMAGGA
jgi:hypothetical protein